MQCNVHIGMILPFSQHMYALALIQGIDHFLLDIRIKLIIKRIAPYRFPENFLELCSYFRHRKSNDREAAFLSYYIAVRDLYRFIIHLCLEFFLFIR